VPPENSQTPTTLDVPVPTPDRPSFLKPLVFLIIIAAFALSLYWYLVPQPNVTLFGSTTLIVFTQEGGRTIVDLSLDTGVQTKWSAADGAAFVSPNKEFAVGDGSVIMLDPAGVVLRGPDAASRLLIASPVPPSALTPLAVWGGGAKIAWRSPADRSLQVFTRNERGVYLPVFLDTTINVTSLAFSDTGDALVVGTVRVDTSTDITVVDLKLGTTKQVAHFEGFVRVIQK